VFKRFSYRDDREMARCTVLKNRNVAPCLERARAGAPPHFDPQGPVAR